MQRRPARQESIEAIESRQVSALLRRRKKKHQSTWPCYVCAIVTSLICVVYVLAARQGNTITKAKSALSDNTLVQKLRGNIKRLSTKFASFPKYPRIDHVKVSPQVLEMCTKTLWHTIETTTIVLPDNETFIHTGDIDDLWLRDSASQIHPLMVGQKPLIAQDAKLDRIVSGLIKRVAMYIRHDPYANAFRIDDTYVFNEMQKELGRHDLISTWNYELDSACFYIRMLYFYWKQSPLGNSLNSVLRLQSVQDAVEIMVDLWIAEQKHELDHYPTGPLFDCLNCNKPYRYKGLPREGKGTPTNATAGLTWTGFRPSDDECKFGYLIPANMFAVVALGYVVDMASELWQNVELAEKAIKLAAEIDRGIHDHGIVSHPQFGRIYAYEVDGLGQYALLDDANVPSLLSAPYLGYDIDNYVYANTRKYIFSDANPTFRSGTNDLTGDIEGYGSVHMMAAIKYNIWPMSLAVRGLASDSLAEKIHIAETLVKASAATGWMHESFDVGNPRRFTRSWFCWADSLFAELVMSITDECPVHDYKYVVHEWRDRNKIAGGVYAAD
ncbi:hypothetical protein MPSEU_000854300 [Mayamaea pseudoterrestris]|nr:hypothetical protein MPSEU_000854300 [Mayamaea pseudoterrestris]